MRGKLWIGAAAAALAAGLGAFLASGNAPAAIAQDAGTAVTPAGQQLLARLAAARPGERIVLKPGDYGRIVFPQRSFDPAIRIEAVGATFSALVLRQLAGVTLTGGTVRGPGGRSYGIELKDVRRLSINDMVVTGAHRGIVIGQSEDVTISGNQLTGLISDGIDIARSRRIVIRGNRCSDFSPKPSVYDADGKRLEASDHPDCVQAWSRNASPPTSDLTIEDNIADGKMQGVFLGNHVRNGVDDGGFDRVIIRNNRINVTYFNGIALYDGRNSVVTGNEVRSRADAVHPGHPDRPLKSIIRIVRGTGNLICGNAVEGAPRSEPTRPCPAGAPRIN